ncbi:hypothetical protein C1645_840194 [Glomus cerebriforme]|uniref:Uncharacterized protein n=1 Tax=Glomus cerebriforme TaxID=658196 RepID=A0A397RZK1_9GLOM|nr:hypothetical protein C1645_840194 [Glomus cerebriforme]
MSEYEVLKFGAIRAAYQISNDAAISLRNRLPTLDKIGYPRRLVSKLYDKYIIIHRPKIVELLSNTVDLIDFRRIYKKILTEIIDPLRFVPADLELQEVVCHIKMLKQMLKYACNRGVYEWNIIIEKSCIYAWIGICSSEKFNYEGFVGMLINTNYKM